MLNTNRIMQGDCTKLMKTLPESSVDFVLTDPPYLVRYKDRSGRSIINDNNPDIIHSSFSLLYKLLKPDSFCVSFYGWNKIDVFFDAWKKAGFKPVGHIVFKKGYSSNSRFLKYTHEQAYLLAKGRPAKPSNPLPDVQPWQYTGNRTHPTEKAVSVLSPLIQSFSKSGDLVFDPFSGSGSTSVAAAQNDRQFLGIELDRNHCQLSLTSDQIF